MKLPNCERAVVDIVKLRDYCLNVDHLRGRHKARVFLSALGLTAEDAERLRQMLLNNVCRETAVEGEHDDYGQRYILDMTLNVNNRQAEVRSMWIIRRDEDFPRLTSCYVL